MKNVNNAKVSTSPKIETDPFGEMIEAVFLFIREHYADFAAVQKGFNINYSQYAALITIYMYGGISEGDLAKTLFINPSTVSRMVYALEGDGWLRCERDKVDRRKVMVYLTAAGKRRMDRMRAKQAEILARQVESLDKQKRDYVFKTAELVNQALRYMTARDASSKMVNPG